MDILCAIDVIRTLLLVARLAVVATAPAVVVAAVVGEICLIQVFKAFAVMAVEIFV